MRLPIKIYGEDVLRAPGVAVDAMDESVRQLIADMLDTMRAEAGLGLAAQQVGRTESVCIVDTTEAARAEEDGSAREVAMPLVLINPAVTLGEGTAWDREGCLSFPDIYVRIRRAPSLVVTYKDTEWRDCRLEARGFLARVIQHEFDHLQGKLLVDRMSQVQKVGVAGKLKRLKNRARQP
jgi:peptide deformylase